MQDNGDDPIFGDHTYEVTPRYIKNGLLEDLDAAKTARVKIDVSPFNLKNTPVAYVGRFGLTNKKVRSVKAEDELLFDIQKNREQPKDLIRLLVRKKMLTTLLKNSTNGSAGRREREF